MEKRYFGTDGIRGRVGSRMMTPEFVMRLGWAAGRVLVGEGHPTVLIGKDTRISGYMLESALQAGLSAAGIDIRLLGPMPTPGIAYLTRTLRASAGIVISASHNPYYDNGIKFFSGNGTKLPDEVELAIEAELDKPMETVDSADLGKAERVNDAAGRYIEFCKSAIPERTVLHNLKIVVDCANGATYHIAPHVFEELGATVVKIAAQPNGLNINESCGATEPQELSRAVLANQAHIGIALDGDGDRLILVDHKGEVVDGDEALYIIASSMKEEDAECASGVVGTLMSNLGMELALRDLGIPFARAAVGDRYVMELLKEKGWKLGGESSGHIICLERTSTGDGIIAALQILYVMSKTGKSLHELKLGMTKFPQTLLNVPMTGNRDVLESPQVQMAVKAVEQELGDEGRVLLRPSGTEPLVRVMVEGRERRQVEQLARQIADAVSEASESG